MTGLSIQVRVELGTFQLDVTLRSGSRPLALVGANGSGKTTLMRVLAGGIVPEQGRIVLDDVTLFDDKSGVVLPPEKRSIGYVPQGLGLFPHLDVLDNVAFGLRFSGMTSKEEALDKARRMLERLDAKELAQRRTQDLSGGERQRVALARALVTHPKLLLLDEPLSALDVGARREVRAFLAQRLREFERPSIVVTHDLRDIVVLDATVCVLDQGRVVQLGDIDELRSSPASEFVAELTGVLS